MAINYTFKTNTPQYIPKDKPVKLTDCIDIKKYKDILGNILYLGLEDTFLKETDK